MAQTLKLHSFLKKNSLWFAFLQIESLFASNLSAASRTEASPLKSSKHSRCLSRLGSKTAAGQASQTDSLRMGSRSCSSPCRRLTVHPSVSKCCLVTRETTFGNREMKTMLGVNIDITESIFWIFNFNKCNLVN